MIGTYRCGRLTNDDATRAANILARFGGVARHSEPKKHSVLTIAYFDRELTYQERVQITAALTNEGIFAL